MKHPKKTTNLRERRGLHVLLGVRNFKRCGHTLQPSDIRALTHKSAFQTWHPDYQRLNECAYEAVQSYFCFLFPENISLAKHHGKMKNCTAQLQISAGYFPESDPVESDRK